MALQRFVENYSFSAEEFNSLKSSHRITEEEIIKFNGAKLEEKSLLTEKKVLEGKTVWRFPIARYDNVNANGRKYEKRLWQRVINEQKDAYQGNVGLADHPGDDEDGQFKNSAIVWLNMGLDEDTRTVWGEGVFVGNYGKLAEEILESGGRCGFSTSGWGELEESDKSTVRWDSYTLERPSDLVLNPSQGVYGKYDMRLNKNDGNDSTVKEEKTEKNEPSLKENVNTMSKLDETATMKLSKLEEKKFRRDVETFFEEAVSISDKPSRLAELEEILSYFNEGVAPDLQEKVQKEIDNVKLSLSEAITNHSKLEEELGVKTVDEIKEGLTKLATDTKLYERQAQDWQEIAEALQEKNQKLQARIASLPTVDVYEEAINEVKRVKKASAEKSRSYSERIKALKEQITKESLITEKLNSEIISANKALEEKNSIIAKYKNQVSKLKEEVSGYREILEKQEADKLQKKMEERRINIKPVNNAPISQFANYRENKEVVDYYNDLEESYGSQITPYKERILACKTFFEASKLFVSILPNMNSSKTTKISEALPVEERKRIIEAQTGTKIVTKKPTIMRMPPGWD